MSKDTGGPRGPWGGKTTVSRDGSMVRKVFMLGVEEAEELRSRAYHERRREAEIVRDVLRKAFGMATEETAGEETAGGETAPTPEPE